MKHVLHFLLLSFVMIFFQESYAMSCTGAGNMNLVKKDDSILGSISVPPEIPAGSVIWRSEFYTTSIQCWQDNYYPHPEDVYMYLNIDDAGASKLGDQIELGLEIDGRDYKCSDLTGGLGEYCGLKLEGTRFEGCSSHVKDGCIGVKRYATVSYRYFIAKKQNPGASGQSGPVTNASSLTAVQFNGVGGPNHTYGKNFSIYLHDLKYIKYVGCPTTVDIIPRVITFDPVGAHSAKKGNSIGTRKPFDVKVVKPCNAAYGVSGSFRPISGSLEDQDNILVPVNNASVGIRILDKNSNGQVVPFRSEFVLAQSSNQTQDLTRNFEAELLWMSDQAIVGPFNASAQLEVYYK
ncbi:fimbrial protein [Pseudomonas aeruginosa]